MNKKKKIGSWTIYLNVTKHGGQVNAVKYFSDENISIQLFWEYKYGPNAIPVYEEIKSVRSIGKVIDKHRATAHVSSGKVR